MLRQCRASVTPVSSQCYASLIHVACQLKPGWCQTCFTTELTHQHGKDPDQGFTPGAGGVGPVPQANHARHDAEDAEEPLLHDRALDYVQLSWPSLCNHTACLMNFTDDADFVEPLFKPCQQGSSAV